MSTEAAVPATEATSGTGSNGSTTGTGSKASSSSTVDSATKIQTMDDLRTKAPKVYKAMQQGIAMQIISQSQHSNERLIQMMKENRNA